MRLLKVIVALVILAFAGLAGYAYLGDMTPRQQQMRVPVTLSDGTASAGRAVPAAPASPAPEGAPETAPEAAPATTTTTTTTTATPDPAGTDALD